MIRTTLAIVAAGAVAFAAPAARHRPSGDEQIARQLQGLVPGKPQSCISPSPSESSSHYGSTVLLRDRAGVLYRTEFEGACTARSDDALITRQFGTQLCRGEIVEIRDLTSGISRGACAYSDFVPYRRPK